MATAFGTFLRSLRCRDEESNRLQQTAERIVIAKTERPDTTNVELWACADRLAYIAPGTIAAFRVLRSERVGMGPMYARKSMLLLSKGGGAGYRLVRAGLEAAKADPHHCGFFFASVLGSRSYWDDICEHLRHDKVFTCEFSPRRSGGTLGGFYLRKRLEVCDRTRVERDD